MNMFFLLPFLKSDIVQRLNFGDINYSYLTLDKEAKGHIPLRLFYNPYDITVISYYDNNLTFIKNGTKISKTLSKECILLKDENNKNIDAKKTKI